MIWRVYSKSGITCQHLYIHYVISETSSSIHKTLYLAIESTVRSSTFTDIITDQLMLKAGAQARRLQGARMQPSEKSGVAWNLDY
jgi:hypothetical protein